jgi:hypothetical protein
MWFRYYNPRIGRFMSSDPLSGSIGDPQSLNKFAYGGNSPANFVDPAGLCYLSVQVYPYDPSLTPADPPSPQQVCLDSAIGFAPMGYLQALYDRNLMCSILGWGCSGSESSTMTSIVTFTIRQPGQTFGECLEANANNYSVAGLIDNFKNVAGETAGNVNDSLLGGALAGNNVTGIAFLIVGTSDASATNAATTAVNQGATKVVPQAMGNNLKVGGKTGPYVQQLFPKVGRPPQVLARSATTNKALMFLTKAVGEVTAAIDLGFTGGLALNCAVK